MEKKQEPIKVNLYRPFMNVAFGEVVKWKVIGNPSCLIVIKDYATGEMFVNEKQKMHFLKFKKTNESIVVDTAAVEAIIVEKNQVTIVGDFNGDKKDDIKIQRDNAKADLRPHSNPNKK